MVYMDRLLLGSLISMTAVAYYSTAYELVTKLWIFPTALLGTLFPAFASSFARDPARTATLLHSSVRFMFLAIFPIVLVLVTMAPEGLHLWLGEDFSRNSTPVLRWLAIGMFFNCFGQIAFAAIQGAGRPDLTGKLHILELPFYLMMLWWLVARLGIEGAAIAWTLRVAMDTLVLFGLAYKQLGVYDRALGVKWISLGGSMVLFTTGSLIDGVWLKGFFVVSILGIFGHFGWSRILVRADRQMIRCLLQRVERAPAAP
jgi:O-antigen/teichoic acid export membrane protein